MNLKFTNKRFLLFALALVFASCQEEEIEPTPTTPTTTLTPSQLSVTVNGTTYNASGTSVFNYYGDKITCRATLSSTMKVVLAVPPTATVGNTYPLAGTYDLSQPSPYPYMACIGLHETYVNNSFYDAEEAEGGSVTITAHDTQNNSIQGTFNFSTEDFGTGAISDFTNGSFTFYY